MNAPYFTPEFTAQTEALSVRPVTVQVRELGRLTEILLTVDRDWTPEECAIVAAADGEAAEHDPFWSMM